MPSLQYWVVEGGFVLGKFCIFSYITVSLSLLVHIFVLYQVLFLVAIQEVIGWEEHHQSDIFCISLLLGHGSSAKMNWLINCMFSAIREYSRHTLGWHYPLYHHCNFLITSAVVISLGAH